MKKGTKMLRIYVHDDILKLINELDKSHHYYHVYSRLVADAIYYLHYVTIVKNDRQIKSKK